MHHRPLPIAASLFCLAICSDGPSAQQLLKDVNAAPIILNSTPVDAVVLGNTTFVVANDGAAGREIFRVDGFTGIPRIALDHVPGPISGVRPGMTVLGNSIVFADLAQGVQVYDPATQQVQLVLPGGRVLGSAVIGHRMVFLSIPTGGGLAFFGTDGTAQGTEMITSASALAPLWMTVVGNELWFTLTSNTSPRTRRVVRTDGTAAGTTDFVFNGGGNVQDIQALDATRVVLTVEVGSAAAKSLWITDGTPGGTLALATGSPTTFWRNPTKLGAGMLMERRDGNVSGLSELWFTDGTVSGTRRVQGTDVFFSVGPIATFGSQAVFFDNNPQGGSARRLFSTDGVTHQAIALVRSPIAPRLTSASQRAFFAAGDTTAPQLGRELWVTDGTAGGTGMITEIRPGEEDSGIAILTAFGNNVFLRANDGVAGTELWRSDGTAMGTQLAGDLTPTDRTAGSRPRGFISAAGRTWFLATDGPWTTDGTRAGTVPRPDLIAAAPGPDDVFYFAEIGNELFYVSRNSASPGTFVTDGTTHRQLTSEILSGNFTIEGERVLFFTPVTGSSDLNLWDASPGGANVRSTISGLSNVGQPHPLGQDVLFGGNDSAAGYELRSLNSGLVIDLNPGPSSSSALILGRLGSNLIFAADDGATGNEPWVTDGTAAGTVQLADTIPGAAGSFIRVHAQLDGLLYFSHDNISGEIWATDGTPGGTRMVVALGNTVFELLPLNGRLLALSRGNILSVIDLATSQSTTLAMDVLHLTLVGDDRVMFDTGPLGGSAVQIWESDGTSAGTRTIATAPARGGYFLQRNGQLLFSAEDPRFGIEPFILDIGAVAQSIPTGSCFEFSESFLSVSDPVLGTTMSVTVDHGVAGSGGLFVLGFPGYFPLTADCRLEIDLTLPTLIQPILIALNGRTSFMLPIPNVPALVGIQLSMQAALSPGAMAGGGPVLGYDLTQSVALRLGR